MAPMTSDPSLYMKNLSASTVGLLGNYVDHCLFTGNAEFLPFTKKAQDMFQSRPIAKKNIEFICVQITNTKSRDYAVGLRFVRKSTLKN